MPPFKAVKTYERKNKNKLSNSLKSVSAVNALFAQNIKKRLIGGKKKKIKLKLVELPPRTETYLTDDSLKVSEEDTFDKVVKGKVYNEVKKVEELVKVNLSESSDSSKSKLAQISVSFRSPIMTRRRRKQTSVITELEGSSSKEISVQSSKSSSLSKPVNISLYVERENKKVNFSSLSYIKLPKIKENEVISQHCISSSRMEASYEPIFSDTFRERQSVHSSTPYLLAPIKKVMADSISPISKSDSSKLIEKSYDEIRKWDSNFPALDVGDTPKGPVLRRSSRKSVVNNRKGRKLSVSSTTDSEEVCQDWKLKCQPKIYLKPSVVLDLKEDKLNSSSVIIIEPSDMHYDTSQCDSRLLISDGILKECENISHDHSYCNPSLSEREYVDNVSLATDYQSALLVKENSSDIIESSVLLENNEDKQKSERFVNNNDSINNNEVNIFRQVSKQRSLTLKPGKLYRRTLSLLRRSTVLMGMPNVTTCASDCVCIKCLFRGRLEKDHRRTSIQIVPTSTKNTISESTILERYARGISCYVQEQEIELIDTTLDDSIRSLSLNSRNSLIHHDLDNSLPVVTAKDVVLRRCGQTEPLPFSECYPISTLQHCQKIGEGVYGEVFLYRNQNGGTSVIKIIPIEGDLIVNGERQKKFEEILSEIVIAMELSNLRNNKKNYTSGFSEVQKVKCTQGSYPDRLLDLWELYDETRGSENDSPQMFHSDQLYIILELANGGQDLETFVFNNAQQAFSTFKQTACALAVAESQLKFEHRDLHWGNILINKVEKDKTVCFRLNGKDIEVEAHGVEAAIIDFTLSRIEFDGVVIFNNLSLDNELFVAKGDYQFDIYRLMQKSNGNEWQHFEPYSNILWLHYILEKAVTSALRYKYTRTKIHKEYLKKLKTLKDEILSFRSVEEFVNHNFI